MLSVFQELCGAGPLVLGGFQFVTLAAICLPWSQRLSFILYSEILRRKPLLLFLFSTVSTRGFHRSHRFMLITKIIKAICVAKFRCKE